MLVSQNQIFLVVINIFFPLLFSLTLYCFSTVCWQSRWGLLWDIWTAGKLRGQFRFVYHHRSRHDMQWVFARLFCLLHSFLLSSCDCSSLRLCVWVSYICLSHISHWSLHIHSLIPPVPVSLLSSLSFLCPVAPHLSFSLICLPFRLTVPFRLCVRRHPSGLCRLSSLRLTCLLSPFPTVCCRHPSDLCLLSSFRSTCLLSPFLSVCLLSPFLSVCLPSPFWSVPAVATPINMSVVTLPVCVSAVTLLVCVCCDPSDLHVCCHPSRLYVWSNPSGLLSPFPSTRLKSPLCSEVKCSIPALEAWMRAELIR